MALKISNERDTVSIYGDVTRRVLKIDGVDDVVKVWTENLSKYAKFIEVMSVLDDNISRLSVDMAKDTNSSSVNIFINKLSRVISDGHLFGGSRLDSSMPISYTLFYDIVDDKIVFSGVPDRTIFILDENFTFIWSNLTTNFGKALVNYIVYPTDKNLKQFKDELLKRIARRVKSNYKKYITDGLIGNDNLVKKFACGEVLSSDAPGPFGPSDMIYIMDAIQKQESFKEDDEEVVLKNTYSKIVDMSGGNYYKLSSLKQTDQLMSIFVDKYGYEPLIDYYLKTTEESSGVTTIVEDPGTIISKISKYMPLNVYKEYLIFYIKLVESQYKSLTYGGDISGLYGMLEDDRAKSIISSWGELYSTRKFPNAYHIDPSYKADRFAKYYYNMSNEQGVITYIADEEYDKIAKFINEINKNSMFNIERVKFYNKLLSKYEPYSKLKLTYPSLPDICDIPTNYIYIPELMNKE